MDEYLPILRTCTLFQDLSDPELSAALQTLNTRRRQFSAGQIILSEGSPAHHFGLVLAGLVQVNKFDFFGNKNIFVTLSPSDLFAETFALSDEKVMTVEVTAASDCTVLLFDGDILYSQGSPQLLKNALRAMANKNQLFDHRIEVISERRTRDKLMAYLHIQSRLQHSSRVAIPYDRQELADYLGVNRSGLSVEIGKLCQAGVLACSGKTFTILL